MTTIQRYMARLAIAAVAGLSMTTSRGAAADVTAVAFAGPEDRAPVVTARDVEVSNAEVAAAYGALIHMWTEHFDALGEQFAPPALRRYRGTVRTNCGVMPQNNAVYCPQANTIYFDEVFVAAVAKHIGRELGTDGDMAAVGVIAHEVGHAVAIQLGYASRFTYANEATADGLAGAFARSARADGSLEEGDLEEAYLGMAMAGDAEPELTGDERVDSRIRRRATVMGNGTREQRMENFRSGLNKGPPGCLPAFAPQA